MRTHTTKTTYQSTTWMYDIMYKIWRANLSETSKLKVRQSTTFLIKIRNNAFCIQSMSIKWNLRSFQEPNEPTAVFPACLFLLSASRIHQQIMIIMMSLLTLPACYIYIHTHSCTQFSSSRSWASFMKYHSSSHLYKWKARSSIWHLLLSASNLTTVLYLIPKKVM